MKWTLLLIALLVLALATPAAAALKELPEEQSRELNEIALDHVAVAEGIDVRDLEISEAWVHELRGLGKDVYMVVILHGDDKHFVAIDVEYKAFLTEEEMDALIEVDAQELPSDLVFTTGQGLDLVIPDLGAEEPASPSTHPVAYWAAGAVLLLGLGVVVRTRQ